MHPSMLASEFESKDFLLNVDIILEHYKIYLYDAPGDLAFKDWNHNSSR